MAGSVSDATSCVQAYVNDTLRGDRTTALRKAMDVTAVAATYFITEPLISTGLGDQTTVMLAYVRSL